mgnify:CR=1 FL=1
MKHLPEGFKGLWIPREIWFADDISLIQKCLLPLPGEGDL